MTRGAVREYAKAVRDQAVTNNTQDAQQPPPSPTNLTATVNADGSITLTWDAPDDDPVTGYQILRRVRNTTSTL